MPIYEYACPDCGHHLEIMQKISDEPLRQCPKCESKNIAKLISAAQFRLKGGGWYETDFKDSDKKKNLLQSDTTDIPVGSAASAASGSTGSGSSSSSSSDASTSASTSSTSTETKETKKESTVNAKDANASTKEKNTSSSSSTSNSSLSSSSS